MKKVVFCEIAWMKYYSGVSEDDQPVNGGKYVKENKEGGEIYNFAPYNHQCYGYVMHQGEELHIERYDKILRDFDEVRDMTVVWVASDGKSSKIVGWYEHATMYRFWQQFYDSLYCGDWRNSYNFVAEEKDCYLIDEKDRSFVVPRAPLAGKGKGMGQSQVWYADSEYAQEEIIPKVIAYLESMKEKCIPIYDTIETLSECAPDHGETAEELMDQCVKEFSDGTGDLLKSFAYANLAVEKDDCMETRELRGDLYSEIGWYNEAEEEYKTALHQEENLNIMEKLMYIELMMGQTFLAIELGETIRQHKNDENNNWDLTSGNLVFAYIGENEFDKAAFLIAECEKDGDREYGWIEEAKMVLAECRQNIKKK
ncbi:tetratricopeptide repeat protein [Jutongia huaianensis]|uniref:Tetratricopeptide repeat protein n=1 Tax=Jutongia huaianensis TaxID=2763668 RepID=A0ABR7N2Y9_9FIRM|nr:hypothetical protein [Jutongia huaianensis]MBC8562373.1 hypothetical protein [Jutongia huaianensis]